MDFSCKCGTERLAEKKGEQVAATSIQWARN